MEEDLTVRVHEAFKSRGLRLSVAESCTGGLIGHMLTEVPGASQFFDSSVVAYSLEAKRKLLGVKAAVLKKHGSIGEETARAMAEALRAKTKTDFSLAVTGNLGPSALEDKPVGLVWVAVAFPAETTSRGFRFQGTRAEIKEQAAQAALKFLREAVSLWT